jgi:integral membrane protein (TIGR01906 family)
MTRIAVVSPTEAQPVPPLWVRGFQLGVKALLPVVLVLTNVRALMTPLFLEIEYRLPGFPADPYGFSLEDRLQWAPITLDYLLNDSGPGFLADLRFESGEPLYNARELRHMDDVKRLAQAALRLWIVGGLVLILFAGALMVARRFQDLLAALSVGALLTLLFMLALALLLALSFSFVFVGFHRVFFVGDTWLFQYSDTLIRLFPERFWRDAFIFIAGATLLEAGAIYLAAPRRRCIP